MTTDFLTFLLENWNVIKNNPKVFIVFGVFVFLIGFGISWTVHNFFLEKKLHNIPEREALQEQISKLKEDNTVLKEKLRRFELGELIQETFREESNHETIGEVITRNKGL